MNIGDKRANQITTNTPFIVTVTLPHTTIYCYLLPHLSTPIPKLRSDMDEIKSIGTPGGPYASTCGYCSPPGERSVSRSSYHTAYFDAVRLSCDVYQRMIDRGWRRSGTYCYKPDLLLSCCPQYTIKLDALEFKPSKSQRKLINRWNRFILRGKTNNSMDVDNKKGTTSSSSKPKKAPVFSLSTCIHASEIRMNSDEQPAHKFEVILEPASYTLEKYRLYEKYQAEIHNDRKNTSSGFKRFLVDSPLVTEPIPYSSIPPVHLPPNYGSYHQLYKLDGQLIAMAVLDILPKCVSSVYFMYDNDWEEFSLGKLSALREASLAREIREAGAPGMGYLYMGFYIHSCQKMRYKGDYSPSYLADPETYEWYPLEKCVPLLNTHRYACFSQPSHSVAGEGADNHSLTASSEVDPSDLDEIRMIVQTDSGDLAVVPINLTSYWDYKPIQEDVCACTVGFGTDLSKEVVFCFYS